MIIVQRFGRPQSIRLDQHLPDIVVIWLLWQQISCSGENGKCLSYHEVKNNNVNKKPPNNFKILLYDNSKDFRVSLLAYFTVDLNHFFAHI